ncbi:MAG: AAA family ATPase [Thermoproteota archaeon]|nr:AAA family ATPase [Thermoproteota archaeon]
MPAYNSLSSDEPMVEGKRLLICITGMPGAGKSTVATLLRNYGFSLITMGDVVREQAKLHNLEMTDANLGNLMLKLRKDLGPAAVAHLILKKIKQDSGIKRYIAIDGIRSIDEVKVLKTIGSVRLLAIHASAETRYNHIKQRGRADVPLDNTDFLIRDQREIDVGISEAIAMSDEVVSNNNLTMAELQNKVLGIVRKWLDNIDSINNGSFRNYEQ